MKNSIEKLMEKYGFSEDETLKAIDFVHDLMEIQLDDVQSNFPGASRTIGDIETSVGRITGLWVEVNDLF